MILHHLVLRDFVGYLASSLVLAAFCVRGMIPLRLLAIASNLAFISYGHMAGLHPVLALHLLLLPTNVVRLLQLVRDRSRAPSPHAGPGAGPEVPRLGAPLPRRSRRLGNS